MPELVREKCVACRRDSPLVTDADLAELLPIIPHWDLIEVAGAHRLRRRFRFNNFQRAMDFTAMVAAEAEEEGHHPRLVTEWGRVTVDWWTHKIRGLHRNDFIMAAKTDRLAAEMVD